MNERGKGDSRGRLLQAFAIAALAFVLAFPVRTLQAWQGSVPQLPPGVDIKVQAQPILALA